VKELTVGEILDILDIKDPDLSLAGLRHFLLKRIPTITSLSEEDLRNYTPSELKTVWEAFKEINTDFFGISQQMGLGHLLGALQEALQKDFSKWFVDSLKKDMEIEF